MNTKKEKTCEWKNLVWAFICVPLLTLVVVELIPTLSLGKSFIFKPSFAYRFAIVAALFAFKYIYKMIFNYKYIARNIGNTPQATAEMKHFRRANIAETIVLLGTIALCVSINNCVEMIPCIWNITGRQLASTVCIWSIYLVLVQLWTLRYNSNSARKAAIYIENAIITYEMSREMNEEMKREEAKKGDKSL